MKYYVNVDDMWTSWYKDAAMNILHREDGPAVIKIDGIEKWYINGKLHREDGPAVVWIDGYKSWYKNDLKHRENGPAVEYPSGTKYWYLNGLKHRTDGPAVEYADGKCQWWIEGRNYTEEEFNEKMNPVTELTVADIEKLLGKKVKIVK